MLVCRLGSELITTTCEGDARRNNSLHYWKTDFTIHRQIFYRGFTGL
jgi:hypothetical protein